MISQERQRQANLLVLDGGDSLYGDETLAIQSGGAMIVEAMNMMRYDALALGQRDLRLGLAVLKQRMAEAHFPFLSANVRLAETGEFLAEPYLLLERGGLTIGVIGLTGVMQEPPSGLTVDEPLKAVREVLPAVEAEADLVIVLGHLGWAQNVELAELSSSIDLIIGGGTQVPDAQPYRAATTGTQLAQAEVPSRGHAGRLVGRWQIGLGPEGELAIDSWQIVTLDTSFADDPALVALVQRYASSQ